MADPSTKTMKATHVQHGLTYHIETSVRGDAMIEILETAAARAASVGAYEEAASLLTLTNALR